MYFLPRAVAAAALVLVAFLAACPGPDPETKVSGAGASPNTTSTGTVPGTSGTGAFPNTTTGTGAFPNTTSGSGGSPMSTGTGTGTMCTNDPDVECPHTGTACLNPTCTNGFCGVAPAVVHTDCTDNGGSVCDSAGVCIGCLDDSDCKAGSVCMGGGSATSACVQAVAIHKRVFVTQNEFPGTFGTGTVPGAKGAYALCQAAANSQSLGGEWFSWTSDGMGVSPAAPGNFQQSTVPYVLLDSTSTIVANDWTHLISGQLSNPIDIDETGAPVSGVVWTGTATQGVASGENCLDWKGGPSSIGDIGSTSSTGMAWTQTDQLDCTQGMAHLYCFEQ